jgi:hypothetical protein
LAIEFLLDEAFSFCLSQKGLLLLFVMEKYVELLNSNPFIVFVDFR